jgi:phosphoglycolate phosphatase
MYSVFFDLDGTLTDPKEGIMNCLRFALGKLGRKCPPDAELTQYIGPPLRQSLGEILSTTDDTTLDEALRFYRQRFGECGLFENSVYDGVPETLHRLQQNRYSCHVVTSKPYVYAERIIEHFGLRRFFKRVYGSHLDGRLTEKAELIAHVLRLEDVRPQQCVMIGDRHHDISGARANAVFAVAVTWGYGTMSELVRSRPTALCEAPRDLPRIVDQLFSR